MFILYLIYYSLDSFKFAYDQNYFAYLISNSKNINKLSKILNSYNNYNDQENFDLVRLTSRYGIETLSEALLLMIFRNYSRISGNISIIVITLSSECQSKQFNDLLEFLLIYAQSTKCGFKFVKFIGENDYYKEDEQSIPKENNNEPIKQDKSVNVDSEKDREISRLKLLNKQLSKSLEEEKNLNLQMKKDYENEILILKKDLQLANKDLQLQLANKNNELLNFKLGLSKVDETSNKRKPLEHNFQMKKNEGIKSNKLPSVGVKPISTKNQADPKKNTSEANKSNMLFRKNSILKKP